MKRWMLGGNLGANGEYGNRVIEPSPFRIGRRLEATLRLPRTTVSGLHAELSVRQDRLFVRDLASTNGTFVNGRRIAGEVELRECASPRRRLRLCRCRRSASTDPVHPVRGVP